MRHLPTHRMLLASLAVVLVALSVPRAPGSDRAATEPVPAIRLDRGADKWADKTLRKMTLEEKVGQVFMIWVLARFLNTNDPGYLELRDSARRYGVGGFALSVPVEGPVLIKSRPEEAALLLNRLQGDSRLPLLVAADLESGLSVRLSGGTVLEDGDRGHIGEGLRGVHVGLAHGTRFGVEEVERADDLTAQAHRQRMDGVEAGGERLGREARPPVVRGDQVLVDHWQTGAEAVQARALLRLDLEELEHAHGLTRGGHHSQVAIGCDQHETGGSDVEHVHTAVSQQRQKLHDVKVGNERVGQLHERPGKQGFSGHRLSNHDPHGGSFSPLASSKRSVLDTTARATSVRERPFPKAKARRRMSD
jgi:hypothetical protein